MELGAVRIRTLHSNLFINNYMLIIEGGKLVKFATGHGWARVAWTRCEQAWEGECEIRRGDGQ